MIRETYKGQEIRTAKGRKPGTVKLAINGFVFDERYDIEERVVRTAKGAIDLAEQDAHYRAEWYRPTAAAAEPIGA